MRLHYTLEFSLSYIFMLNNMANKHIFKTKNRIFGTVFAHKREDTYNI